jgi:hypothetical protein
MGQPMARRLAQAGFSVIGFNRTRSRTPVYQYLSGALAKQLMAGGQAIANPFLKSALMSAASADRLGVAAPLAHQIARQEPPLPVPR